MNSNLNKKKIDLLSPIFLISYSFIMEYLGIYLYSEITLGNFLYYFTTNLQSIRYGFLISLLCWFIFLIGYFFHKKIHIRKFKFKFKFKLTVRQKNIFSALIFTIILAFYLKATNGISIEKGISRSELTNGLEGKILFLIVNTYLGLSFVYFGIIFLKYSEKPILRYIIFSGLIIFNFFLLYSLDGKSRALMTALCLLFVYHYKFKPLNIINGSLIVAILLFILSLLIKESFFSLPHVLFGPTGGRTFDALYNSSRILTLDYNDFLLGKGWFCGVWNDLAGDCSSSRYVIMRELFNLETINLGVDPGKIGEAYINFGLTGLFLLSFIAGFLSRVVYTRTIGSNSSPKVSQVVSYFIICWVWGISNMTGYFFENLVQYVFMLVVINTFGKLVKN